MSQPFDRGCTLSAPGEIDPSLGEFWTDHSWNIPQEQNLSFFERNQVFLNMAGENFLDIGHLSGADSDGDGRAAVAADFNHDGRLDLVVRQVGGGPLLLFENRFPQNHYLSVSLRATRGNRLGIGARLTAQVAGRTIVREMYPINSFQSQAPSRVHFGLGSDPRIDQLTIRWPGGTVQEFRDIAANRHIVLQEGSAEIETVVPGQQIAP